MRILRFNKSSNAFIGEIYESQLVSARMRVEINGEHSLTLTTTQKLGKGERLLLTRPKKEEFVVAGVDEEHLIGDTVVRTYYCVWSLQEDLQGVMVSVMPGVRASRVTSSYALDALLSTQTRWSGACYLDGSISGRASMYDRSAWDALSTFLEVWGGEVYTRITNDSTGAVTARELCVTDHVGNRDVVHRFDFGRDMTSIKRSFPDTPLYCRITPRGKGEQTENGGYGRKITIASVNSGKDYLENTSVSSAYRLKNPDGTYIYPTLKVENSECETPADLKTWAQSVLSTYTTPQVVYTVDASVLNRIIGSSSDPLHLGDEVHVSDDAFGSESIKLESRIIAIDYDLLEKSNTVYTIGASKESISAKFSNLGGAGGTNYSQPSVSSAIGGVEPATTASIDVPSSTITNICSVSLPPGVWIVTGQITFGQNGTGRRVIKLSTTSRDSANVPSQTMQLAVSDVGTRMSTTRCFSLATQTTVYLIGNQGSGTTLTCSGLIEATKVG